MNERNTTLYDMQTDTDRRCIDLPAYIEVWLNEQSEELNRTGSKSILLFDMISCVYPPSDVRHETEKVLNSELEDLGYDIQEIDNHEQNKGRVKELKDKHGEELTGYKEYRLPEYISERDSFQRKWRDKVKECFEYYMTCYRGRSERIRVKTQIIQYEEEKEEPSHPVAQDLAGLQYDFRYIEDIKDNFDNLDSWDEREKAICQLYNSDIYPLRKSDITEETYKYSEFETERYYKNKMEEIYETNNMFEYKFSDRNEMTKDEAIEEMKEALSEEAEKEIVRMYIENIRDRRTKEYETEKFSELFKYSGLLGLDVDYKDIVRHITKYPSVRKHKNRDSLIVIESR